MFDKDLFTGIFKDYCCGRGRQKQLGKKSQACRGWKGNIVYF